MVMNFALFYLFACACKVLCDQGSCGAQPEPAAPQGAAGCGCGNLQRSTAVEPAEDGTADAEPADKYSRDINVRQYDAHGDKEEMQSKVICRF